MKPHDDDGDAGERRELQRIGLHQRADRARAGAEGDEHGRETAYEQQRRANGIAPDQRLGFGVGQPLERSAGEIDEIGRHQRQHAGRQEAQHAREQCGGESDIVGHAV